MLFLSARRTCKCETSPIWNAKRFFHQCSCVYAHVCSDAHAMCAQRGQKWLPLQIVLGCGRARQGSLCPPQASASMQFSSMPRFENKHRKIQTTKTSMHTRRPAARPLQVCARQSKARVLLCAVLRPAVLCRRVAKTSRRWHLCASQTVCPVLSLQARSSL